MKKVLVLLMAILLVFAVPTVFADEEENGKDPKFKKIELEAEKVCVDACGKKPNKKDTIAFIEYQICTAACHPAFQNIQDQLDDIELTPGPPGPTLGIFDSLGLASTGPLPAGDAGGRTLFNLGDVGIGTDSPDHALDVDGNASFISGGIIFGTTDAFSRPQIWNKINDSVLRLGSLRADGDLTNANSQGIVVYGRNFNEDPMASPNYGFARVKPDRFGLLSRSSSGVNGYLFRIDLSDDDFFLKNNAGDLVFDFSRATGQLFVSGNVGVGTSNPTKKLDVVGDVNATGDLYVGGTCFRPAELVRCFFPGDHFTWVDNAAECTGAFGTVEGTKKILAEC